jgi:hypothetical protein
MKPVVADYRTRNLLILREPATARVPVTTEVASSSLVVPAIFINDLQIRSLLLLLFLTLPCFALP